MANRKNFFVFVHLFATIPRKGTDFAFGVFQHPIFRRLPHPREAVLKPFIKRANPSSLTGICASGEGLSLARVVRRGSKPPRLELCEFVECQNNDREQRLQETIKRHGLSRGHSIGVMETGSYNLLQVTPPAVPEAEMKEAVRWQIKDLIDYPLAEAVTDLFQVPNIGSRGRPPIAYVVAARLARVKEQARLLKSGRLKVNAIDIPELALRNVAALLPADARGMALLHIGPERGLITVTKNGSLFLTRNVNLGSRKLSALAAETPADSPQPSAQLQDLLESLVLEIQRSLDFFESQFSQPPVGALVVAPTEDDIPGLIPYLDRSLAAAATPLDLAEVMDLPTDDPALLSRCLTAIGAALRIEQATP